MFSINNHDFSGDTFASVGLVPCIGKFKILKARKCPSKSTQANGINFRLSSEEFGEITSKIWTIKSNGDELGYGVTKVLNLMKILNLESISTTPGTEKSFNGQETYNVDIYKDLIGKSVNMLVNVRWNLFDGIVSKQYDIVNFLNQDGTTIQEKLEGQAPTLAKKHMKTLCEKWSKAVKPEVKNQGGEAHNNEAQIADIPEDDLPF